MKKNSLLRKALVYVCCAMLLVSVSVAATIAYFTDTEAVTNTFTVGKVGISLDEAEVVATSGEAVSGADRVQENDYHLVPGKTYVKDPTVHVDDDSENCWLFVKIVNEIAAIEIDEEDTTHDTIAEQMKTKGWTPIEEDSNIYAYKEIVSAGADIVVFEEFTIDGASVTNDILADYADKTVKITAYAIQAAGFESKTAKEIWTEAKFK